MAKGYVEPLPSGRFRAVVSAGAVPITGRRVKVTEVCDTESAARIACDRLVDQVEAEATPDRTASVATLIQTWLDVADHEVRTESTARRYVKRQIVPALGHVPVRKLQHRVDLIDRSYVHLRRCAEVCDGRPRDGHICKPLAPATIRQIHAWLSRALSYAVSWGWIERNPAQFAHPPKFAHRQARPPEPEEVARLLNKAFAEDSQFGLYLWLAVTTGARRAGLAALRWHRVRVNRAALNIERNYMATDGQHIEKTTKTDSDRHLGRVSERSGVGSARLDG